MMTTDAPGRSAVAWADREARQVDDFASSDERALDECDRCHRVLLAGPALAAYRTPRERRVLLTAFRDLTRALGVLARAGHDGALSFYLATRVRVSREMRRAHPEEPDYVRALAHALVLRAEAVDARPGGPDDAAQDEAVELCAALAREEPWPRRASELSRRRARAGALYERHRALPSDRLSPLPRPK